VGDCSDIDEIIVFREDGKCIITKVQEKVFVGKEIIHVAVFKKNDERTIYNMIYKDGASGISYIKRFAVTGVTRDKEYDLTKGSKGSKVLYFSANPNGEAEIVNVQLKPHQKLKKLQFDEDFAQLAIKGRGSMGNIITKYPVKKIILKSKGLSTLAGRKIWYDEILKRLNVDGRGKYLGEFDGDDRILNVFSNGVYELTNFDLNNHFDDKMVMIEKYNPEKVYSMVHYEGKSKNYLVKRFVFDNIAIGKQTSIISEESGSKMVVISGASQVVVKVDQLKGATKTPETVELNLADLIDVKGMKAMGNRLSVHAVQSVTLETEHDDEQDVPDPTPEAVTDTEIIITPEDKNEIDEAPTAEVNAADDEIEETPTPPKKIDFEITNPDDIDIDDGGQLGLF
jgi:topoisomerase-4 subunit A